MASRDPMLGTNSKSFDSVINSAMKKLDAFDARLNASNKVLGSYTQEFNRLNKEINDFGKSLGSVKINKSVNNSRNFSSQVRNNQSVSRGINRVSNKEAQALSKALNNVGKSFDGVGKSALSVSSMLVRSVNAANIAIAAFGAVIAHTVSATKKATQQTMELNRAILGVGGSSKEIDKRSNDITNLKKDIGHTLEQVKYNLGKTFEPIEEGFLRIEKGLLGILSKLPGVSSNEGEYTQYNESDSNIRWYTSGLQNKYNEPETKSVPAIGNIGAQAKQSGFDNKSASNLAIGTYNMAMKEATKYGLEASEVANDLADAWLNGSDAAKRYGVVVDDQVLSGYMATQGVDIVNVEISEAQKQYYRYLLMEKELNSNNSQAMSKNIQQWKKLGMEIDATKQKLFSFDEVITLTATDTNIPSVGNPGEYNAAGLVGGKSGVGPLVAGDTVDSDLGGQIPFIPFIVPGALLAAEAILNKLKMPVTKEVLPLVNQGQLLLTEGQLAKLALPATKEVLPLVNNSQLLSAQAKLATLGVPATKEVLPLVNQSSYMLSQTKLASLSVPRVKEIVPLVNSGAYAKVSSQLAVLSKPITIPVYTQYIGGGGTAKMLSGGLTTKALGGSSTRMLSGGSTAKTLSGATSGASKAGTAVKAAASLLAPEIAIPVALTAGLVEYANKHGDPTKRQTLTSGLKFASGGIGTREINNATLFEGNRKEAVIPLESSTGIDYLANAMREAGVNNTANGGDVVVNLTLSGVNIADNEAQWQKVGEKIAEVIEVQKQRRGELSYGSKY